MIEYHFEIRFGFRFVTISFRVEPHTRDRSDPSAVERRSSSGSCAVRLSDELFSNFSRLPVCGPLCLARMPRSRRQHVLGVPPRTVFAALQRRTARCGTLVIAMGWIRVTPRSPATTDETGTRRREAAAVRVVVAFPHGGMLDRVDVSGQPAVPRSARVPTVAAAHRAEQLRAEHHYDA